MTNTGTMKSTSNNKWNSFDVFKGILRFTSDKTKNIPSANPILHNAFYNLSIDRKFSIYFSDYFFERKPTYHYSKTLEIFLMALKFYDEIIIPDLDKNIYKIQQALIESFERVNRKNFSEKDISSLQKMANNFVEKINGNSKEINS